MAGTIHHAPHTFFLGFCSVKRNLNAQDTYRTIYEWIFAQDERLAGLGFHDNDWRAFYAPHAFGPDMVTHCVYLNFRDAAKAAAFKLTFHGSEMFL